MSKLQVFFEELGYPRAIEPHARIPLHSEEMILKLVKAGRQDAVIAWAKERHEEIELEEADPYRYGWRGDPGRSRELGGSWKRMLDAIEAVRRESPRSIPKILCMGGNGSSKSEAAAWYAMKRMVEKPRTNVAVLCPSEKQARLVMMARLFKYLPSDWRPSSTGKLKTGMTGNISYSEKMGFTENSFILPNGSSCTFFFYEDGDAKSLEGLELDLIVADEEVPLGWLEAGEYRLTRRRGVMLAMFTPISGVTPTVSYFRGVLPKTLEEREAELLPFEKGGFEKLPMLEMGSDRTKRIVYFWTQDCPYPATNYETLKEEFITKRATRNKIKERAYGIPMRVRDSAFPLFNLNVHCLPMESVPDEVTWYHVMDPANARNAFMQWWACDRLGRKICVREWPQQDDYIPGVGKPGAWAVQSVKAKKKDGDAGDAQESWGLSYQQMADEIERVEKELARLVEKRTEEPDARIKVARRILDSRLGSATMHGTTIQKEYAKVKIYFTFASGKQLNVTSAESEATAGITMINNALFYHVDKPLSPSNSPQLYVVYEPPETEDSAPVGCANTAFALRVWTGADGQTGKCKEGVDCTHYFLRIEPRFLVKVVANLKAQWGGYGS